MNNNSLQNIDQLYQRVREIIDRSRRKIYQAISFEMVQAYWHIGREIVEEEQKGQKRAAYGSNLLKELSGKLTSAYGKGFDESNLRNIRQFYMTFPKYDALRHELSWTHYRLLMRIENANARDFYLNETIAGNWSTRQLERQINSLFYERTLASRNKKGMLEMSRTNDGTHNPDHIIKDPYVLEFLDVKENERIAEKELEAALIEKLQNFLLELGKGFSFVKRQYRINTETGKNFYIDLVFYNYILKCFLLIDLKTDELTHQDIGQMDMYVRMFEDIKKQQGDNPTIGLILCTAKDKTVVKYSVLNESKQIFASRYQMYLPSEKQLQQEIEREKHLIEMEKKLQNPDAI